MTDPTLPVEPTAQVRKPLSREEYSAERKELYKYQQENWANFEKTLLTLSSGFLAFSMSFLAFLARPAGQPIVGHRLLWSSWIALGVAVAALLVCYPLNIRGYTFEIVRIEDALTDPTALDRLNPWSRYGQILYGVSAVAFLLGLVLLAVFCKRNFVT